MDPLEKKEEKTVELEKKNVCQKACQLYFFANNNLSSAATGSIINIFVSHEMVDFSNSKPGKWQLQSHDKTFYLK